MKALGKGVGRREEMMGRGRGGGKEGGEIDCYH